MGLTVFCTGFVVIGLICAIRKLLVLARPGFAGSRDVASYHWQFDTLQNSDPRFSSMCSISSSEAIAYYVYLPIISSTPTSVTIAFFYDQNMNGSRDGNEPMLTDLQVSLNPPFPISTDATLTVSIDTAVMLHVEGTVSNSKPLLSATFQEPHENILLPEFPYTVYVSDVLI